LRAADIFARVSALADLPKFGLRSPRFCSESRALVSSDKTRPNAGWSAPNLPWFGFAAPEMDPARLADQIARCSTLWDLP
jgi:hypothetical protein